MNICLSILDLTGAQDGSVRMFEWTRPQQLVCFRQAGNARVTRMYFNSQGNKVSTAFRIFPFFIHKETFDFAVTPKTVVTGDIQNC